MRDNILIDNTNCLEILYGKIKKLNLNSVHGPNSNLEYIFSKNEQGNIKKSC